MIDYLFRFSSAQRVAGRYLAKLPKVFCFSSKGSCFTVHVSWRKIQVCRVAIIETIDAEGGRVLLGR